MHSAVHAEDLHKHFYAAASFAELLRGRLRGRRIDALQRVSFGVDRGEIVGLLGPNGAGKSTLLQLIGGLLLPDGGRLTVLREPINVASHAFRGRVSYVACSERSFSWRLTGRQNLDFFAALYGLRGADARTRVGSALEQVELGGEADRAVREYSSGMRQRLALARGLLGDPQLFLFDEPTRGIDPRGAEELRRFIRRRLLHGKTAIVATHDLAEVGQLCDRVVLIDRGVIRGSGSPAEAARLLGLPSQEAPCSPP